MRPIIVLLIAVCSGFANAVVGAQPAPPEAAIIVFHTMLGNVTFLHNMHATLSTTECSTCHHTFEGQGNIKSCHDCHDREGRTAPAAKKVFHLRCIGCHEYTVESGVKAGPGGKKCLLCHVR